MALVHWPRCVQLTSPIECAICGALKSLGEVAAGHRTSDGHQVFACNSHFYDTDRLITGWADFAHAQRRPGARATDTDRTAIDEIYIEHRIANNSGEVSADLSRHLYTRLSTGIIVVVADNPRAFRPVLLKRWRKIIYYVQRARASTLNAARILELTKVLAIMQRLAFTSEAIIPTADDDFGVYVLTSDQALESPQLCATMYVTSTVARPVLSRLAAAVQPSGLLVVYAGGHIRADVDNAKLPGHA